MSNQENLLTSLVRAGRRADRLLQDQSLAAETREAFRYWWDERRQVVAEQLEERWYGMPETSLNRLQCGLGIHILDPEQNILHELHDELASQIWRLSGEVGTAQGQLNGHAIPHEPKAVLDRQIAGLEGLKDQVRGLRLALNYIYRSYRLSPAREGSDPAQLRNELEQKAEQPLNRLLDKLYRLERVVSGIKGQLLTAYKENGAAAWQAIGQWQTGWAEAGKPETVWIPPDLKAHKTLIWINRCVVDLKALREDLDRALQEIAWCLRYQDLEADLSQPGSEPNLQSSNSLEVLEGREWAEAVVERNRAYAASPVEVQSLLELAQEKWKRLKQEAEPEEYAEFVQGAAKYLEDSLQKAVDQPLSEVIDLLERRIQAISRLRQRLQPILGGGLPGTSFHARTDEPFSIWEDACRQVVEQLRTGKFDRARQTCDQKRGPDELGGEQQEPEGKPVPASGRPSNLAEALAIIDDVQEERAESAMERVLMTAAAERRKELEEERKKLQRLKEKCRELEVDFNIKYDEYSTCMEQYRKLRQGFLAKLTQKRAARKFDEAKKALQTCWDLCPEEETVKGQARERKLEHRIGEEEWQRTYLGDLGCAARPVE